MPGSGVNTDEFVELARANCEMTCLFGLLFFFFYFL